ncbi:MAG TPA: nitroreductase family protein [Acidimicrobiales bacterium]
MSDEALSPHELLTTTRSVRRGLDLSRSIDPALLLQCLEIALQAPNGADEQAWRWIVVTDSSQRERIGDVYHRANAGFATAVRERAAAGDEAAARKLASSETFWDHLGDVPALIVAAFAAQPWFDGTSPYALASAYGSIFPAVWNLQLALRLEGLGSCLVTSHLRFHEEVATILGLPPEFHQAGILAVGHLWRHRFSAAPRGPIADVVRLNYWRSEPDDPRTR